MRINRLKNLALAIPSLWLATWAVQAQPAWGMYPTTNQVSANTWYLLQDWSLGTNNIHNMRRISNADLSSLMAQSSARAAGRFEFYDDFQRPDSAAGVLGTSTSGFAWQAIEPTGSSGITNAIISGGRLMPKDPYGIFYAVAQVGSHKAQASMIAAEVVWSDMAGANASQLSLIIAGQTNTVASWGVHTRMTRSGWALGYIDNTSTFVDLATGSFAATLAFDVPHYVMIAIDPDGASADFAGEHVRVDKSTDSRATNFWHYAMNTTAERNWVIYEHYSLNPADMTDKMQLEWVAAGANMLPPNVDNIVDANPYLTSLVGTDTATFDVDRSDSTDGIFSMEATTTTHPILFQIRGTNNSAGSGSINAQRIDYVLNTSGSGGYRLLRITADEQTIGSGVREMISSGPSVGSATFTVDILGNVTASGDGQMDNLTLIPGAAPATLKIDSGDVEAATLKLITGAEFTDGIIDWSLTNLHPTLTLYKEQNSVATPMVEWDTDSMNVQTDVEVDGAVSTTTGLFSYGGYSNSVSTPFFLHDISDSSQKWIGYFGVSGSSTNGTNVSIWSAELPDGKSGHFHAEIAADGEDDEYGDVLDWWIRRPLDGAATVTRTNHLSELMSLLKTNVWFELDGNDVHLYISAELTEKMNALGVVTYKWSSVGIAAADAAFLYGPYDFEETGTPTADLGLTWTTASGSAPDYDYSSDPLAETESLQVLTSSSTQAALAAGTADTIYVAFRCRAASGFASGGALIDFRLAAGSVVGQATIGTSGAYTLRAFSTGGAQSGPTAEAVTQTAAAWSYVMVSCNGTDGDTYVWCSNSKAAGWGSSVSDTTGTTTGTITRFWLRVNSASVADIIFDNVIVDTDPIDINEL